MLRRIFLSLAIVAAVAIASAPQAEAGGGCYRGGHYGGYYGGYPSYRSAHYYGGPGYYHGGYHGRRVHRYHHHPGYYGHYGYSGGRSGVYLSFGF